MRELSSEADDTFEELLAHLDDALAAGWEPSLPTDVDGPPELLGRWQALHSAAQRRFAQALSELHALDHEAMAASDLLWLYRLAQAHALVAAGTAPDSVPPTRAPEHERERCAGRAVDLLETLRAKAYFENQRKREVLQTDHTFDALRMRPAFVKLLF